MTVVDDVKARLDILEVVSQRVPLQRSGRSYKANCPFHQERTPSFHVFPDRQSWRCFGACATGGDAISFVMRAENLEFGEALRQLAQQTGVPLQERRSGPTADPSAYQINESAKAYFQRRLASTQGAEARDYLGQRALDRQAMEAFEVGLSPSDGESLRNHLTREGYSAQQLADAGVLRTGDDGFQHDLFRGRLMFPIRDAEGRLAGFGGRSLDGSEPKYLNSPQGPVFDKSRILYALDRARDDIRKNGAVIVEGYMDAIAAHQAGFKNVVASMGTALTEPQVDAIRRLTNRVIMALDQDPAGQQATLRSLESSWHIYQSRVTGRAQGTTLLQRAEVPEIRIAAMPDGQDPDEVIHRSPAEWARLLDEAKPLIEYVVSTAANHLDGSTPQGKAQIVEAVFPLIAAVKDATQQDHYFQLLAERLSVSIETLRASVARPSVGRRNASRQTPQRGGTATTSPFARLEHDPVEEYCLALLLRHPELIDEAEGLRPEVFARHENREILSKWLEGRAKGDPESLRAAAAPEVLEQLKALEQKSLPALDLVKRKWAFADVVARLEERELRRLKAEEEILFSESPPDLESGGPRNTLALNQRIRNNETRRGSVVRVS